MGGVDSSQVILDKLRTLVIPAVVLEQATIEEAVEFLRLKSKELDTTTTDPERKGVNFILQLPANGTVPKINSLNLKNVPLGVAVDAVARMAGLRSRIEPYAVVVTSAANDTELFTRVYRVPPSFLNLFGGRGLNSDGTPQPRAAAIDMLKQSGVDFPEHATAFFSPATSTVTVRNTKSNLDLVSQFIDSISNQLPRMINVRAEFYRLPKKDGLALLDELDSELDATAALKKLRADSSGSELIQLVAAPSVQTRSGQRVRVQSGRGQPDKNRLAQSKPQPPRLKTLRGATLKSTRSLVPMGIPLM